MKQEKKRIQLHNMYTFIKTSAQKQHLTDKAHTILRQHTENRDTQKKIETEREICVVTAND